MKSAERGRERRERKWTGKDIDLLADRDPRIW